MAEAEYIESSKPCSQNKEEKSTPPPLPWKAIFTSVPFLALTFAHVANNAGWSVPKFFLFGNSFLSLFLFIKKTVNYPLQNLIPRI